MRKNLLIKIICSFPVILVVGYFVPAIAVILSLFRYVVYGKTHFFRTPIVLLIAGLICLLPRGLELAMTNFNFNLDIPYWTEIMAHPLYPKFTDYGKFLAIFSVILLVVTYVLRSFIEGLSNKFSSLASSYYQDRATREDQIEKEAKLESKIKEIESKQKTPHAVKCPHCGKTNHITGTVGRCKACRSAIEYKGK